RRHGIESAGMPGVATPDAFQGQPAAAQTSKPVQCLEGVLRAGRIEAAPRPQQRADDQLIQPDQESGDLAHAPDTFFHSAANAACSSVPEAPRARARALTTRSTGGSSC